MTLFPTGAIVGTYLTALLFFSVLASFGSIITYVIIVVANRAEPDPSGHRTRSIYHVGAAFIALWLEIAGVITIFASLFGLIGAGSAPTFSTEIHPLGDSTIRGVTIGLLLALIGGYTALTHRSRAIELADADVAEAGPSRRVLRSYAAVVSFLSVLVVVVTAIALVWTLLGLIAPGVYQAGSRTGDTRLLLDELTVLAVFGWVFSTHRRLVGTH